MADDENELYLCTTCILGPCMFVCQPLTQEPHTCPKNAIGKANWENANEVKSWQKETQKLLNSKRRKRS